MSRLATIVRNKLEEEDRRDQKSAARLSRKNIELMARKAFEALDDVDKSAVRRIANEHTCDAATDNLASEMRSWLSAPCLFVFVSFLARLAIYVKAQKDADKVGAVSALVPKPKNDFDATLLAIWHKQKKWLAGSRTDGENMYAGYYCGLHVLLYKLGEEFGISAPVRGATADEPEEPGTGPSMRRRSPKKHRRERHGRGSRSHSS